eukprot:UN07727
MVPNLISKDACRKIPRFICSKTDPFSDRASNILSIVVKFEIFRIFIY